MPSAVRYPRGTGYGLDKLNSLFGYGLKEMPAKGEQLEIGKGRIIRRARATAREKAVILSIGTRLAPSLEAAQQLEVRASGGLSKWGKRWGPSVVFGRVSSLLVA